MKKTMRIFVLAVAMMLALCCSAQAITQSEIQGVWDVDVKELLISQGLEAADVEALLAIVDMSMTIEFTADQKMIMKTDAAGEVSTEEYAYTLTGDYIVADGNMRSTLKRTGNELTMKDPDGTTIVMTLHGAGAAPVAPAADNGIVGVWDIDIMAVMKMSGASDEEIAEMEPLMGLMSATMEFTADGRCIMVATAMGQEVSREEAPYKVYGNTIELEGDPATYVLEGNTLTITESDITMTLTRNTTAEPTVTPVAPAASAGSVVGVWKLDVLSVLEMSGQMSAEELEEMKPLIALMSATMEFTADGRCIMVVSALGEETNREEMSYSVEGNTLYMNGSPNQFVLEGNTLKINGAGGMDLTLTK